MVQRALSLWEHNYLELRVHYGFCNKVQVIWLRQTKHFVFVNTKQTVQVKLNRQSENQQLEVTTWQKFELPFQDLHPKWDVKKQAEADEIDSQLHDSENLGGK